MNEINLNPSRKELKWFALGFIIFFAVISWFVFRRTGSVQMAATIAITAAVIGTVGFFVPAWMRMIYVPWMIAVFPIGWVVSLLLMAIIFFLVVTPIGLLMRLFGRDPMQRSFDSSAKSYWISRDPNPGTNRYFRQF